MTFVSQSTSTRKAPGREGGDQGGHRHPERRAVPYRNRDNAGLLEWPDANDCKQHAPGAAPNIEKHRDRKGNKPNDMQRNVGDRPGFGAEDEATRAPQQPASDDRPERDVPRMETH